MLEFTAVAMGLMMTVVAVGVGGILLEGALFIMSRVNRDPAVAAASVAVAPPLS